MKINFNCQAGVSPSSNECGIRTHHPPPSHSAAPTEAHLVRCHPSHAACLHRTKQKYAQENLPVCSDGATVFPRLCSTVDVALGGARAASVCGFAPSTPRSSAGAGADAEQFAVGAAPALAAHAHLVEVLARVGSGFVHGLAQPHADLALRWGLLAIDVAKGRVLRAREPVGGDELHDAERDRVLEHLLERADGARVEGPAGGRAGVP